MADGAARLLVVEDNDDTREVLEKVLIISGHRPVCVADAYAALRYLRAGNAVQVIVLDLHLPGMDGRKFLRELRSDPLLAGIPVIAYSGDPGSLPDVAAFVRKGSDDPDVLLNAIVSCLRSRAA